MVHLCNLDHYTTRLIILKKEFNKMSIAISASTMLVHIDNPTQSLNLFQIRKREKNISLPAVPTVEQMNNLGYHVVQVTPRPSGDVVTQGPIVLEDGVYKQSWEVREYTPEERSQQLETIKQSKISEINSYQQAVMERGIEYNFPNGVGYVQVRDGDRANLASLRIEADAAIRDNDEEFVRYFRDYDNNIHQLTAAQIVDMTNQVSIGFQTFLGSVWELKDLIKLAESVEDIPEIPTL